MGGIAKGCVREVSLAGGKLYTDIGLCGSAHTSGCVVDGLGAMALSVNIFTELSILKKSVVYVYRILTTVTLVP